MDVIKELVQELDECLTAARELLGRAEALLERARDADADQEDLASRQS